MKLSRITWFILGAGIFVIATGSLFAVYRGEAKKQEELNEKLSVAQNILPKLVSQRQELESQLSQLESDMAQALATIASVKAVFPESVESIEYDEVLFNLAHNHALEVQELQASEPKAYKGDDESISYMVTIIDVQVTGEVSDILDYFNSIVNDEFFTTADVELVEIDIPLPMSEEETQEFRDQLTEEGLTEDEIAAEIEKSGWATAKVKINILSYEGEER